MKKLVKFAFCALSATFILALSNTYVHAQNPQPWIAPTPWAVEVSEEGETILRNSETDQMIVALFRLDEYGNQIDLDLATHAEELNAEASAIAMLEEAMPPNITVAPISEEQLVEFNNNPSSRQMVSYRFNQTSRVISNGSWHRVSNFFQGPMNSISASFSHTSSHSFSAGINLSATAQSAITSGVNFAWVSSSSSNSSQTITHSVPAGRTAHIEFLPRYNTAVGTLTRTDMFTGLSTQWHNVRVTSPVQVGSFTDGTFRVAVW